MDADQLNTLEWAHELAVEARKVFGDDQQDMMLVEEASELCTAVSQFGRGRCSRMHIEEEAADVIVVALGALGESGWIKMREKLTRLRGVLDLAHRPVDRLSVLEVENARLRAELERLSGNGPLIDPSAPKRQSDPWQPPYYHTTFGPTLQTKRTSSVAVSVDPSADPRLP